MLEGRGASISQQHCIQCGIDAAKYRCDSCFDQDMFCKACLVSAHRAHPFHVVKASNLIEYHLAHWLMHYSQKWNGNFFEPTTLKSLGLRTQLGHGIGSHCRNPQPARGDEFFVIHTNGIHTISLDFCACETAPSLVQQLLRSRLFPTRSKLPRSAATFQVLRNFQLISFESKITAFGYFNSLSRLTNNTVLPPPVRHLYNIGNSCLNLVGFIQAVPYSR